MEYADGGTLGSIFKKQRQTNTNYDLAILLDTFKQLAKGMNEINRTLIHRDIKPDNILLCGSTLKISDFGLSKIAVENTRTMTFKGGGTPLYMAPEAWDYSKNTIQMDIYSMGIVFYELATLHYPYDPIPLTTEDCKNAHLLSSIVSIEKINSSLPASLISVINRMLEKSTKRRFSNWNDIIQLLEKQIEPDSPIDKIVAMAITAKNAEDIARQTQESAKRKKDKEKFDFCKLIYSQFENTIIAPLVNFSEKINSQYAGNTNISCHQIGNITHNDEYFSWKMDISSSNALTFNIEAILKENHTCKVYADRIWGGNETRTEYYIPQYKGKNILAWGEVLNQAGYGFNLLLLDSGDIYGDWVIMNNKNNFSKVAGNSKREPFPFDLQELPLEINNVQVTHLYSTDFEPFNNNSFLNLIKMLAFDLLR
jgi:serine/threonine protein kinase